jgi:alpha-glucuronidase
MFPFPSNTPEQPAEAETVTVPKADYDKLVEDRDRLAGEVEKGWSDNAIQSRVELAEKRANNEAERANKLAVENGVQAQTINDLRAQVQSFSVIDGNYVSI